MGDTTRGKYVFTVKEYEGGQPWICFEPYMAPPDTQRQFMYSFELPKGTSYERAKEIAAFMRENLDDFSCTTIK
ncbi:MAG: hypothetical protein ACOZAR_01545 [Patescibacteria group bacterium]